MNDADEVAALACIPQSKRAARAAVPVDMSSMPSLHDDGRQVKA
jgi:hypothetical protein